MIISIRRIAILTSALLCVALSSVAQSAVDYAVEALGNGSTGDFAPYYIASNRHGKLVQSSNALLDIKAEKSMSLAKRFDYGFGVETIGGYSSKTEYGYFDAATGGWREHGLRPSTAWLQQLYGIVKYRGTFLEVGMREHTSEFLNFELSSGDLVYSGNARPIPQVRVGFVDFQNIPFTNGWIQIAGVVAYGKYTDDSWLREHYNYYNWHMNTGSMFTYKRCHFRTNPMKPLSLTVGMQVAGSFGGTTAYYEKGEKVGEQRFSKSIKTMLKMFLPTQNEGKDYYTGSSLGSWDAVLRYRFPNGTELKAYIQKPFEDGSGIGWLNGFDGIWGLEVASCNAQSPVTGAVFEYLDFTNQSGPLHWNPADVPGTTITSQATGGDEYYNNYQYNSYMNYGMSIGTPFLKSPLYNKDGFLAYTGNVSRGFHLGVKGHIVKGLDYRALMGYRKTWGSGRIPMVRSQEDFSTMGEVRYEIPKVSGLAVKCQIGVDSGQIYGESFGGCLSVSYRGSFNIIR